MWLFGESAADADARDLSASAKYGVRRLAAIPVTCQFIIVLLRLLSTCVLCIGADVT